MSRTRHVTLCCVLLIVLFGFTAAQFTKKEGDPCQLKSGGPGVCKSFDNCDLGLLASEGPQPVACAWDGEDAIVCCPAPASAPSSGYPNRGQPSGPPSGASKAEDKCKEYTKIRQQITQTIVNGEAVKSAEEYPHSALLGYGEPPEWLCGATLISDRYLLTAAHCLTGTNRRAVSSAHLGFLNKDNRNEFGTLQAFRVVRTHKPPERKVPQQYADIALLELDRPVQYTSSVLPACLHTDYDFGKISAAQAIGWGDLYAGDRKGSNILQKVKLALVNFDECSNKYPPNRKIPQGLVQSTQFCAGDNGRDTCQGDSGGPLQIHDTAGKTRIIGVTSFGQRCGVQPGVYTRVSAYISWIESVVWP